MKYTELLLYNKHHLAYSTSANMRPVRFSRLPAEWLKLKHSYIWIPFLLLPTVSASLETAHYLQHVYFFLPPLLGFFCSYLWHLEHKGNNWLQLMVHSSPWKIVIDKYLTTITMLFMTLLWTTFLYVLRGKYIGIEISLSIEFLQQIIYGFLCGTAISRHTAFSLTGHAEFCHTCGNCCCRRRHRIDTFHKRLC